MAYTPVGFNPFTFLDKFVPAGTLVDKILDKAADKFENIKPVNLKNGILTFNKAGDYSFETLPNGKIKVVFSDGAETVLTKQEWASVKTFNIKNADAHLTVDASTLQGRQIDGDGYLNITGIQFAQASFSGGTTVTFEASHNLDAVIADLVAENGSQHLIDHLTVNGNKADAIKLLWDYVDDHYSYYANGINEIGVRLGVEYAEYLKAGGEPLTNVVVKVNASGRLQSMHDNLLGNLDIGSIKDKFLGHGAGGSNPNPDPDTANELLALIQQKDLGGRPYYDGNPVASNGAYDAARAWDWDHGLTRTDWIDRSFGKVDPLASEDRDGNGTDEQMAYGTLNSNDRFNIVRHEGAGVELALKIKEFGPNGGDYSADHVKIGADGTAHFNVSAGASPDNANRADWSFDYAATVLPSGSDEAFTFKLKIDTDASEGVNLVEVPTQLTKGLFQNSSNLAFFKGLIDIDPATDGVQPYAFGEGEFTFVLEAYDGATKIAENKVVAHVGEAYWTA